MKKRIVFLLVSVFVFTSTFAFAQSKPRIELAKKEAVKKVPAPKVIFPSVDVIKTAESYILIIELPGLSSKDLSLEYIEGEKNYVELKGTKADVDIKAKGKKVIAERFVGKFDRKIDIADDVVKDKVTAEVKNSILIVTLPIRKYQVKTSIKIK